MAGEYPRKRTSVSKVLGQESTAYTDDLRSWPGLEFKAEMASFK